MADYLFTRLPSVANDYFGTGDCGHHGDYRQGKGKPAYVPPKQYTSFNIFTSDSQNLTVRSERPMTIEEAQYYYNALSISGND